MKHKREAPWNRCDECGKFIALEDFADGTAKRVFVTPDSEWTDERYETFCKEHAQDVRRTEKAG